jgi:hypothetical protein
MKQDVLLLSNVQIRVHGALPQEEQRRDDKYGYQDEVWRLLKE